MVTAVAQSTEPPSDCRAACRRHWVFPRDFCSHPPDASVEQDVCLSRRAMATETSADAEVPGLPDSDKAVLVQLKAAMAQLHSLL